MVPGGNLEFLATLWYRIHTATTGMKRIKAGYLLKDILDRFKEKAMSNLSPDRRLWMYFAHDVTIVSILNSLGLYTVNCRNSSSFPRMFAFICFVISKNIIDHILLYTFSDASSPLCIVPTL